MMNSARVAVDRLLDMYDEYKTLTVKIAAAERRLVESPKRFFSNHG